MIDTNEKIEIKFSGLYLSKLKPEIKNTFIQKLQLFLDNAINDNYITSYSRSDSYLNDGKYNIDKRIKQSERYVDFELLKVKNNKKKELMNKYINN